MRRELTRALLAWGLLVAWGAAVGEDREWQEVAVPKPPALKLDRLIPIELPGSNLDFGVQPDSVAVGADGVVRYVVIARSASGALNALYEAVRCVTSEVKVHARYHPGDGWVSVADPTWQPLRGNSAQRHSLAVARGGACVGRGVNQSAGQIVRDLAAPVDTRFESGPR